MNRERDHRRYVTTISYWVRRDGDGLRDFDLDLYSICGECKKPEILFEVKGSPPTSWQQTKNMAKALDAQGALVIEPFRRHFRCSKESGCGCDCHTHAYHKTIRLAVAGGNGLRDYDKEQFHEFLDNCHQAHLQAGHNYEWWKRC